MIVVMVQVIVMKNIGCDRDNDSDMLSGSCNASFFLQY